MAKRGPKPKKFTNDERETFLALLREGIGIAASLRRMNIQHARYKREIEADAEFSEEVKDAEAYVVENLIHLRVKAALDGDPAAQDFLIRRHDKARMFAATMELKWAEFRLKEAVAKGELKGGAYDLLELLKGD